LSLPQQQQQQHSPLQQSVRATQAAATGGKVPAAGGDQALQVYRELFLEGCRESQGPAAVLAALQALLEGPHGLLAAVLGWQPHQVAQAPPSGEGTPLQEQQGSCHGDELGVDTEGSATELSGVLGSEEQVTETGDDGADTDCAEESV
jgi:hypothetical protein